VPWLFQYWRDPAASEEAVNARINQHRQRHPDRARGRSGSALGVISAGRFYSHGKWVFWDVHNAAKAFSIELRDEHYSKLVLESDDPAGQIRRIRAAADGASIT
jgi:hypothetical protein